MTPELATRPAPLSAPMPTAEPTVNERLCHLFRTSLKNGRIHPLYLPVLKYRHARQAK